MPWDKFSGGNSSFAAQFMRTTVAKIKGGAGFTPISLPQTFLFTDTVNDYMGNTEKYVRYADNLNIGVNSNAAQVSLSGFAPLATTGSGRMMRIQSNHQYTSLYAGASPLAINEGGTKRFDLSGGLRVLWMVGNEASGSGGRAIDHVFGFTNQADGRSLDPTHGWPNTYVRGRLFGYNLTTAQFHIDSQFQGGGNVNLLQADITGLPLKEHQNWCSVGFEIPPNGVGNLTVHAYIHADNVPGPHSATVACPDLTGFNLDAPFHVGRGFGATGTPTYGFVYQNACWVGTASDAWPWGGF